MYQGEHFLGSAEDFVMQIKSSKEGAHVYAETGLTPRKLLKQRAELLEALKKCRFDSLNMSIDTWRDIQETIKRIEQ